MKKLLILHGALGSASQMQALQKELSTKFEVYTLDFSGHGKNRSDEKFSIDLFVTDILAFLQVQKITEPLSIFGYSMGGYVALSLASIDPQKIEKIITLATKFDWNEATSIRESQLLNTEILEQKAPHYAKLLAERHGENHWKLNCAKTAEMMIDLGRRPVLNSTTFCKVSTPCKLIIGDKDRMVSLDETIQASSQLKNSEHLVCKGWEHPFEKIDSILLASEITAFLQ